MPQTLWLLYSLFIVYATTLPFGFELEVRAAIEELRSIPLNPLMTSEDGARPSITDMVQNVALFVPFGVLGLLSLRKWGRASFPKSGRASFRKFGPAPFFLVGLVTLLGTVLSATVELLQLFTPYRITSANDVMTNTIGSFLGAAAVLTISPLVERGAAALGWLDDRARLELTLLLAAATLLVLATWHPFDASLRLGGIASKVRELAADPWQPGVLAEQGGDFLRYALFGTALSLWLRGRGASHPARMAALGGAAAAVLLEGSQLVIGSRMPGLTDALVGTAGAAAGAFLGPRLRSAGPAPSMLLLVTLGTLATAMLLLSPFELADERRAVQWTPFLNYLGVPPSRAASHVAELVLAFAPVGYGLRRLIPGAAGWAGVAVAAFALGGALEYAQGSIAGRYPDVTDAVMLVWGAVMGAAAADWVSEC